jgi:hypothetical protein
MRNLLASSPFTCFVQQRSHCGRPWMNRSSGTSGQIAKLERLQKLRESGALTDAEFEREKAKVLAEG